MPLNRYIRLFLIFYFAVAFILSAPSRSEAGERPVPFMPPEGKVLLLVGEDKPSIDGYARATGVVPAGTMFYTSIQLADSMGSAADHGGGIQHGQYLLDQYPQSVVQMGLWMVGALDGVVKGDYDRNIDKIGAWIKKAQRPVFLRIGYEFDLPLNKYEPQAYRLAFRHIVERLRAAQVRNVAFVWHSFSNLPQHPWADWYPGDDYVDWFGVSVFGQPNIYMKKFAEMAKEHHKGFMVAAAAPGGSGTRYGEGSWKLWFGPFFKFISDEKVRVVCYNNLYWDEIPLCKGWHWGDSRVEVNEIVKKRWMEEILRDKYLRASSGLYKLFE